MLKERIIVLLIALLLIFSTAVTFAQSNNNDSLSIATSKQGADVLIKDITNWALDVMTTEKPAYTFAVFPILSYDASTGLNMGMMPFLRVLPRWEGSGRYYRPSIYSASMKISTEGMFKVDATSVIFTEKKWFFYGYLALASYPDQFFGLGNVHTSADTLTTYWGQNYSLLVDALKGVGDRYYVGIRTDINYFNNDDFSRQIPEEELPGKDGSFSIGLGPSVSVDTRDDVVFPRSGSFHKISARFYSPHLGSTTRYQNINIDLRHYFPLGQNATLAVQGYFNGTYGDVPFTCLSTIGGTTMVRSIGYPRKYIDNNAWITQAEYRFNIWWRVGGTAFTGASNVYGKYSAGAFDNPHYFTGMGFRLGLLETSKVNFRIDFAVDNRGDKAFYLNLQEAF